MNEREIILETLLLIEKGEDFSNRIITDVLDKYAYMDRQHRGFIKRVCEGCVEYRIRLDHVIDCYSKTKTGRMKPVILCILRMSVYQLLYMDSVPASAVCNEAVKLAVKKGFGPLKGFVNGVLRSIARNLDKIPYPDAKTDPIRHDVVEYSMPEELVRHFRTHYPERAEAIMRSFFKEAGVTVRRMISKTEEAELLQMAGDTLTKLPPLPDLAKQETAYSVKGIGIKEMQAFTDGLLQVQDQASMQAVVQLSLKTGDTVLDVCAAPGGKCIQAADILCKLGKGTVTACDRSEKKTALIMENAERCHTDNLRIEVADATKRVESYVNYADVLIADLPCSGLGIIGRKADIKYHMTGKQMEELVMLQRAILSNIADYLKSNGTLLYSTCTLNPAENEEQAKWISENLPFTLKEMHQIFPGEHNDGFFFAVFTKNRG